MPLYEYKCEKCGSVFEKIEKFSDPPLKTHVGDGCGGRVVRLLGAPAFHFKGSGWYVTDYGKGSKTKVAGKNGEAVAAKENGKSAESSASTTTSTPAAAPSSSPAPATGDKK